MKWNLSNIWSNCGWTLGMAMLLVTFVWPANASAEELNIYSHRQAFLINPFLEAFTAKTGIKTNVVFASKGLAQRLQREGKNSPADVVLTVDIARLSVYAEKACLPTSTPIF